MCRGSSGILTHRLALVQAGDDAMEHILGTLRQRVERNGLTTAVWVEGYGALGDAPACCNGGGGDTSCQSDDSDDGDEGLLEGHCRESSVKEVVVCI